jgi:hypothetical protein
MSDVSALSHEYHASAKLAEELNDAILAIKKSRLHRRSGLSGDQRESLAKMLVSVRDRLADEKRGQAEFQFLPQEMVERINRRHASKLAYFLEDLSQATKILLDQSLPVDDAVISVLDEVCDVADQTASSMFRRMRRR